MIPGPILRRELRSVASRSDVFVGRLLMAILLGAVVALAGAFAVRGDLFGRSVFPAQALKNFGAATLAGIVTVQILILGFLVPSLVGGAIAEERERDTLPFLLISRLTRLEIVLAKLIGRLAPALSLTLVGVPFIVFAAYMAALFPEIAGLVFVGLVSTTLTMGALSLQASAQYEQAGNARAIATLTVWGWLVVVPLLTFVPIPAEPLLAAPVWLVREFGRWVGPSSPLTLAMNPTWAMTRGPAALAERIGLMVVTQAVLSVLAFALAVFAMKRHEPRRAADGSTAEVRPPCGDDPIFWREHDLPGRARLAWRPIALFRQAVQVVRLIGQLLLQLLAILTAAALPILFVMLLGRLAVPAFREYWLDGGSTTTARDEFSGILQGISGIVALLSLIGVTAAAAGRVAAEREKGTWLILLTTSLEGREILGGKLRATARVYWRIAWFLLPLWAIGALCGAIHPLGAVLAVLDLSAAIWLGLILGLWLGIRPGPPSTAMSVSSLGALAITGVHLPYLFLALVPARFFRRSLETLEPTRLALGAVAMVLIPAATVWLALALTRRAFGRFDIYVDRPARPVADRASSTA